MNTIKNFKLNKKKIEVNQTAFRKREQINIIYVLSEFIDNFKQNFDDNYGKIKNPEITFEFNNQEGYLKISDNGTGFSIIPGLNIGYEESHDGNVNEYGVGMKIALDYLADYSAIVSEYFDDSFQVQKEFAHFIWKQDIYEKPIKLKPDNKSGTSIYIFDGLDNFNRFTSTLTILNENQIVDFPIMFDELEHTDEFLNNKVFINTLLKQINYCLPVITAGLFDRYSPMVNFYKNKGVDFKIKFKVINENGEEINIEPFSWYQDKYSNSENQEKPIFFQEISANDFDLNNTFSFLAFKRFIMQNELTNFLECLSDEKIFSQVKIDLENFFINEVKKYFENINLKLNSDLITLIDFVKNNYQSSISKNLDDPNFQKKYLFSNSIWENDKRFILPRLSLEPLFAGLLSLKEDDEARIVSPYFLNLTFKRLELFADSEKIKPLRTINNEFSLLYQFFVSSPLNSISLMDKNPYKFMNNEFGFYTGFRLIKLDRAIFHGPNYASLENALAKNFSGSIAIQQVLSKGGRFPSRFFNLELFNRGYKSLIFPHNDKDLDIAKIIKGGNVEGYTRNIYGNINLPKKEIFRTSTNKVNLENTSSLKEFTNNALVLTAMMIPSKIIYALSQFVESSKKISEDNFILKIIQKYQNTQLFLSKKIQEVTKENSPLPVQPILSSTSSNESLNSLTGKDILFNSNLEKKKQNLLEEVNLKNMNINQFFENIISLNSFFTKEEHFPNEIIFKCSFHKNNPVLSISKDKDIFVLNLINQKKWNVVAKDSTILENKICKVLVIHILSHHINELITILDSRII